MEKLLKRVYAEINLDHLAYNFNYVRNIVDKKTKILSVVKADAYGCGEIDIATELVALGTDWLGVATLHEALSIRTVVKETPILVFGYTPPDQAELLLRYHITQTVMTLDYAKQLQAQAQQKNDVLSVHLKCNTGMNRLGFNFCTKHDYEESIAQCEEVCGFSNLKVLGIYTHLPSAYGFDPSDINFTKQQFDLFVAVTEDLKARGYPIELRHCATSAVCLNNPEYALEMVRPGSALYGLIVDSFYYIAPHFKPVLSLKATVAQVTQLAQGQPISYGRTYYTKKTQCIATVTAGFADGIQRRMSNVGNVLIKGKICPVVGTVCMDMFMVDVSDVPDVRAGDEVTIIGTDGDQTITVRNLVDTAHCGPTTEILCGIPKRVPRIYIKNDKAQYFTQYIRQTITL